MNPNTVEKSKTAGAGTKIFTAKVFESLRPLVKDWRGFIQAVEDLIASILEEEYHTDIDVTGETEFTIYGKQVGGYRPGMGMSGEGLNPPEYEETYVDVPDEIRINSSIKIKYVEMVREWTNSLRSDLNDPREFQKQFFLKLSKDRTFEKMFIKLVRAILIPELKEIDGETWADIADLDSNLEKEMDYEPSSIQVTGHKAQLKNISHTGSYLEVFIETSMDLNVEVEGDDDMGRYASKWDSLPKGWTKESLKKYWASLTGDNKHKVTACIKAMDGKIDDPGAFCASLADKVDPGWRSRDKKKANRLAARWIMAQAKTADQQQIKAIKRIAPMIVQDLIRVQKTGGPYASDIKALICGFIFVMFDKMRPKKAQLTNQIGRLFDNSSHSLAYGGNMEVYKIADSWMGHVRKLGGWVAAASLAIELLKKGRMNSLSARVDGILSKELGPELAEAVNAPTKKIETPTQVLKRMVQEEMPSAKGLLLAVGKDPMTIRTYVSEIFEDINWHRLAGQLGSSEDVDVKYDIVSKIAQDYDWSLEPAAMFGLAALSLVKDRAGISIIKNAIKREFPDWLTENAQVV